MSGLIVSPRKVNCVGPAVRSTSYFSSQRHEQLRIHIRKGKYYMSMQVMDELRVWIRQVNGSSIIRSVPEILSPLHWTASIGMMQSQKVSCPILRSIQAKPPVGWIR